MGPDVHVPLAEVAFGEGETRDAWTAARRRVRWRFALWSVLCLGGFAVGCVVTAKEGPGAREGGLGGGIGAVSLLTYVCVLYACLGTLRRLRRAREVLKACPWQPVPDVRRLTGTSESKGVPVQFRWSPESEGGEWTRSVVARNPLRWNRWDDAMQHGAWFAGDTGPLAVLALPGGRGLMTVQMRTRAATFGRFTSAAVKEDVTSAVEIPPSGAALEGSGTQEAVQRAERRVWLRFAKWFGGSLVVMLATWLSGVDGLMVLFVLAFLAASAFLTVHCRSLFWLGRVKRVLRRYPWESRPHVRKRKYPGGGNTRVSAIVQLYDVVTKWSPELHARDVWCGLGWKATFDDGAWFAGDMPFGGVMAKPGGAELAFVVPQLMDELSDERESADDARKERARHAKLGKQVI